MHLTDKFTVVFNRTFVIGILNDRTKELVVDNRIIIIAFNDLDIYRERPW